MSYETDQIEYKKQLDAINSRIKDLDTLFSKSPNLKFTSYRPFSENTQEEYYKIILRNKYGDFSTQNDSLLMVEYKICQYRKKELEYKLKETKTSRNLCKTIDYLDGITPRHVSGRVYEVKDGDGCGMFCLWFMIIDGIILLIIYLFGGF